MADNIKNNLYNAKENANIGKDTVQIKVNWLVLILNNEGESEKTVNPILLFHQAEIHFSMKNKETKNRTYSILIDL